MTVVRDPGSLAPPRIDVRGAARRRAVPAAIVLSLLTVLVGLSTAGASATSRRAALTEPMTATDCGTQSIKIAFVSALANTYGQAIEKGFRSYLAPCKNVSVVDFDTGFDSQKEFSTIQDVTTQKTFSGIAFLPLDAVGVIPAVKKATAAGVQVVNFNNPVGNDYKTWPSTFRVWPAPSSSRSTTAASGSRRWRRRPARASRTARSGSWSRRELRGDLDQGRIPRRAQEAPDDAPRRLLAWRPVSTRAFPTDRRRLHPGASLAQRHHRERRPDDAGRRAGRRPRRQAEAGQDHRPRCESDRRRGGQGRPVVRHSDHPTARPGTAERLGSAPAHPRPELPPQGINPFDYTNRSPLLTQATLKSSNFVPQWSG